MTLTLLPFSKHEWLYYSQISKMEREVQCKCEKKGYALECLSSPKCLALCRTNKLWSTRKIKWPPDKTNVVKAFFFGKSSCFWKHLVNCMYVQAWRPNSQKTFMTSDFLWGKLFSHYNERFMYSDPSVLEKTMLKFNSNSWIFSM